MQALRHDPRQWLIHQRGPVEAVVRALEVMALGMAGRQLAKHPHQSVRAVGNLMLRLASARAGCALGLSKGVDTSEDRRTAMQWAVQVSNWAMSPDPRTEPPVQALDELHAAAFQLDSRLNSAGLSGPGWVRDLGRGD